MRCLHCRQNGIAIAEVSCPKCGAHLPFLMRDVLTPGTQLQGGRYLVDYPLGRGGFGITYRAHHVNLGKPVAIKEFFPREHAMRDGASGALAVPTTEQGNYHRALERFIGEGRILALLDHPNVVSVLDSFHERGTAYLVMELLDGSTLRDELDNTPGKQLPVEKVKIILNQLVSALEAIHSQGIYHLDISPDNIQLKKTGQVVLIDFGAARQNLSSSTTRAFKLAYAAPEVLAGTNVGPQSDLFELAMMTGEMLSGVLPPSVLERMAGVTLNLSALDEGWRNLLIAGLRLEISERPDSVASWWTSLRETRPDEAPKSRKQDAVFPLPKPLKPTPAKSTLILPRKAKPKPGFKLEVKKKARRLEDLKPGELDKVRRVLHGLPAPSSGAESSAKENKTLVAFVLGIVASCVLGLCAYFVALWIFEPASSVTQGDYDQHKYAQIISIFVFGLVSLITFFIFVVWFFNIRKKKK